MIVIATLLERPHQQRYKAVERHSWKGGARDAKFQRPPVDANAIKGAGPGIWEELFGYIGLGYRVLPANAIRQLAQLWTYSTMSGREGVYLQRVGGPRRAGTSAWRRKNSVAEVLCILPPMPGEG